MYCPECGGEYRPGIEVCPSCEVKLVEGAQGRLREERGPHLPPPFVDLVGFIDEHLARDARRRLKAAKVPCELVIRDATGPGDGEQIGDEFWIRVPGVRAEEAADLLGLEPVLSESICPSCGAAIEGDGDCLRCGHGNGA